MFKKLIFGLVILVSTNAFSASMLLHTKSWHTGSGFNNKNYGLSYCTDSEYCLGAYKNSYRRTTVYAIKDFYADSFFGIVAGFANGYKKSNPHKFQPIAALSLNTKVDNTWSTKIMVQPALKSNDASVLHLALKYSFK